MDHEPTKSVYLYETRTRISMKHELNACLWVTKSVGLSVTRTHELNSSHDECYKQNTFLMTYIYNESRTQRFSMSHEISGSLWITNPRNQRIFMKHEHASLWNTNSTHLYKSRTQRISTSHELTKSAYLYETRTRISRWVTNGTYFLWHIFIRSHEPNASLWVTKSAGLYESHTHISMKHELNASSTYSESRTEYITCDI